MAATIENRALLEKAMGEAARLLTVNRASPS
jgi:hypothetical protein